MPMVMVRNPVLFALLAALAFAGPPAAAQRFSQVVSVRLQSGQNLPAREIEQRVRPTMPGAQYLGFVYDPNTNIYTLKFLRNGSVIWVDVDGRTGKIVRRTGN